MSNFKVGDTVRIKKFSYYMVDELGAVGTVTYVMPYGVRVEVGHTGQQPHSHNEDKTEWHLFYINSEVELLNHDKVTKRIEYTINNDGLIIRHITNTRRNLVSVVGQKVRYSDIDTLIESLKKLKELVEGNK